MTDTARHNAIIDQLSAVKLKVVQRQAGAGEDDRKFLGKVESALASARAYINDRMIEERRLREALDGLVKAATVEVNEKGAAGYMLARSNARAALEAKPVHPSLPADKEADRG